MTRTEKWSAKREELEKESEEIKNIIKTNENTRIFDEMMGNPMETLEEIFRAFD